MTTNSYRHISAVVSGWWGAGKSWLLETMPGPRLLLDVEGGSWDTPFKKWVNPDEEDPHKAKFWNPRFDPPDLDGDDVTVVCPIREWSDFANAMEWLKSGKHPFNSVLVDSAHELQNLVKKAVQTPGEDWNPNETLKFDAWGRLLNHMADRFRELRDLTQPDAPRPVNVAISCAADDEKEPVQLLLEGRLRKVLAGWFDVLGYLTTAHTENGEEVRIFQIKRDQSIGFAKCRLHLLNEQADDGYVVNPDFRKILRTVNPKEKASA